MRNTFLALAPFFIAAAPNQIPVHGTADWRAQAERVTIARDDWGIAHVHGKTDADAVFGMIYAQAEDDFPRIEANYLTALGRMAEADGESAIWQDLRARLFVSEDELKAAYWRSPQSMRRLMDAWADGLNFYLAMHPEEKPKVLTRFEPWMILSFTEGSIGADIEDVDLKALQAFYDGERRIAFSKAAEDPEPKGSNGIAISRVLTGDDTSLLLINPHTSYFFRSELQMTSDEGLNVYGAVTWGQFFVYQGFNEWAGWMHTTSGGDSVDEFAEKIVRRGNGYCYRFGKVCRPLRVRPIALRYKSPDGSIKSRKFNGWVTHRGPIVRADGDRWIAAAMMNRPVEALQQSFLRTKAHDLDSYRQIMRFQANSSNTTIFADSKGEIAYLHPQFVPLRNRTADYTRPVDGSDPALDWGRIHVERELPNVIRPGSGFVFNTNNWPWTAAGKATFRKEDWPSYMDSAGENPRGIHALQLLSQPGRWTRDRLQAAAFDRGQPGFDELLPLLIAAYDALPAGDARRGRLKAPIDLLRGWDRRWSADAEPNTLASVWATRLWDRSSLKEWDDGLTIFAHMAQVPPADMIDQFDQAVAGLVKDFGRWQVPWGELNRDQRISSAIENRFDDSRPSTAVPFSSARWGSLAAIGSWPLPNTKKWYGQGGNSFVAVVEFSPRGVRARAVTAGGASGREGSPHFADQWDRFASGNLRDVYFYPAQLAGHTERTYRPGE
jgi:acyl-homoserine-lactone acylase